jgi:hypothetical protein
MSASAALCSLDLAPAFLPSLKAGEATLVLADQERLKAALAITRHIDIDRTIVGEHGFAGRAVTLIGLAQRLRVAVWVAQVLGHAC